MDAENKMTQGEEILKYLAEYGKITRLDAGCDLHIFELSSRIGELERKGYVFIKESMIGCNKYGRRTHYTVYRLADNGGN